MTQIVKIRGITVVVEPDTLGYNCYKCAFNADCLTVEEQATVMVAPCGTGLGHHYVEVQPDELRNVGH